MPPLPPRHPNGARPLPQGDPPDETRLREAALAHLARYETTEAGLARMLERRVANWARRAARAGADDDAIAARAAEARAAIPRIVQSLARVGGVDDRRFAERRAARHAREGRSARASAVSLLASGVAAALVRETAARDRDAELDAAVAHAKRKRLGPFAPAQPEGETGADDRDAARRRRDKARAAFARAGFSGETTNAVFAMDPEEAEERLLRLRQT